MDQLRAALATIQKHLGGMTPTQKLLLGSLGVIMAMALFLVSQYAGRPTMVELWPGASAEDQQRAVGFLRTSGIRYEERGGRVFIPAERRLETMAVLGQAGEQPSNSAVVFENILRTQNMWSTREQNRQIYKVMLDNWLSSVISRFDGIQQASVFVDAPETVGFGQTARPPKASITLFPRAGRPVEQATVDAAARLVAGSVAGLELDRVSVTDGTGRPRRVTLDEDLAPATYREHAAAMEKHYKRRIESLVAHIYPPAVVEVTAGVDITRRRSQVSTTLPLGEGTVSLPRRETTTSIVESHAGAGSEPGVRSNQSADIGSGSSRGVRSEQTEEDIEFSTSFGQRTEQIDDPRGHPTFLMATVAVPRTFIAGLIQREQGREGSAPSEADIVERFASEREHLIQGVRHLLQARGPDGEPVQGEVVVTLMSTDPHILPASMPGPRTAAVSGSAGGGALGTVWMFGGGIVDKVLLGVLALVALGMMVLMVRKAGKATESLSPDEMQGLPPTIETMSDLVGEADETETAITGIIVGDDEIKATKLREQVSDLIRKDPEVASKMFNRWVAVEE